MLVRCTHGLGRRAAFAPLRHRSAYETTPLRSARYLTGTSTFAPSTSFHCPSFPIQQRQQRQALPLIATSPCHLSLIKRFATMHRSPAAMVTRPMADPNIEIRTPRDPNTLSNYHNFLTKHTSVDFDVDFKSKRLFGSVVLTLESLTDEDVKEVVLDSRYVLGTGRSRVEKGRKSFSLS